MKLALIGAGGFAEEIRAHMNENLRCFVDDEYFYENDNNIHRISDFDPKEYKVLVAVGDPKLRYNLVNKLPKDTKYHTYIHPSAIILGKDVEFGEGSIVCSGVIVTTNCKFGKHTHLNLHTSIGHDVIVGDFFTTAPGVRVSGNCKIGDRVYLGTNAAIKQKISICDDVTVGLNGGVVKDLIDSGIYGGVPTKLIKKY